MATPTALQVALIPTDDAVVARALETGLVVKPGVTPTPPPPPPAGIVTAPIFWIRFGSTQPTQAQMDQAIANKVRGVLLKCEFKDAANYLAAKSKAAGYTIEIAAYKSLMDARQNAAGLGADQPTFVSYTEAQANGWLTGHVMSGYTYQEVCKTWDTNYQAKCVANAVAWFQDPANKAFTMLFADNLVAPGTDYYGTGQNEQQLSAGCLAICQQLGPKLLALGKKLMPNITDGRLTPGFFAAGSAPGNAGFDEMFAAWPNDIFNTDPASQIAEGAVPGVFYCHSNGTRRQTAVYGLACFWASGEAQNGGAYYSCAQDDYDAGLYWYPEYSMQLGSTNTGSFTSANGVISRTFTNGFCAVNTTGGAQTVTLPAGTYKDANGATVTGKVTVPAMSGVLLTK